MVSVVVWIRITLTSNRTGKYISCLLNRSASASLPDSD